MIGSPTLGSLCPASRLEESHGIEEEGRQGRSRSVRRRSGRPQQRVRAAADRDDSLRDDLRTAFESARKAYDRINGKGPQKALEDKKVQKELKEAATSLKSAADSLRSKPKRKRRKRKFLLVGIVGAGLALALSEGLRNKVLDALFGAEEEFEYTSSTTSNSASASAARRRSGPRLTEHPAVRKAPSGASFSLRGRRLRLLEAATTAPRKLDGEKAGRIVTAMRASVGARGAAGSTFDVVAREAGVSRGLLHYYFGSKERLMVEVVRRDCDTFVAELEARPGEGRHGGRDHRLARADAGRVRQGRARHPGRDLRDAQRLAPQRGDPRRDGRAVPHLAPAPGGRAAPQGAARAWSRWPAMPSPWPR